LVEESRKLCMYKRFVRALVLGETWAGLLGDPEAKALLEQTLSEERGRIKSLNSRDDQSEGK